MVNLLENAIKYAKPSAGQTGHIAVALKQVGTVVRLEVSDNGPGIPEVDRKRVLERFVRLEKSRSEQGSGLGLALVNAVATLRRIMNPGGDTAMLLDIVAEESDRLNRMVADLLDFTRPRNPVLQPEDLLRVLQDAFEAARAQALTERPVYISVEVEPGLSAVPMDRRQIRQALFNVAVNAIQAMPQGGEVWVHARRDTHGGREQLRIDVMDQGPGIPAELLHRVFEPFFTTKAQGTGLGLAVVKRILEEHRGEIAVESAPGRGTTFTFWLPLTQPQSLS
ncbi:MAG: hypothetical protein EOO72_09930 [Myxococcaceae bacterium]|nr:MAG: hypothetical protein EOO72_09930 [Myxococcaceae bacterium]